MVALESNRFFNQLRPEELQSLRRAASEQKFPPGAEIFKEDAPGDGVYVVKDGMVEISAVVGNARQIFSQIGPGEIFGEMAIIENKPRSACATAAKDSTVYFISRDVMLQLLESSPQLTLTLLREISHRLREFNRQYVREILSAERLAVIGGFARGIVHDLKNPLNIISITSEMAGLKDSSEEMRRLARSRIARQVERINQLVSDILEFTQSSQITLAAKPTDYRSFVLNLVEELRPETELRSVSLELANQPPALTVQLDPKRFQRVFYNLVFNAVDEMPDGGKIIFQFHPDGVELITEISDTGQGIAPEIADRLFEAFASHGKARGTGLGLSICKRIVEDHGGKISAGNKPGGGAVFTFTLPLAR